jgi:hypothetical protein
MMFRAMRGAVVAAVAIAMLAVIACGTDDSSTDAQAPAAVPEPTATPVPTVSSEPITANPADDPTAFIAALPDSERQCLVDALGEAVFGNLLAGEDPSDEDGRAILGCLTNGTIQRVIVGQVIVQGGIELSDATLACVDDRLSTVDFLSLGSLLLDGSGVDSEGLNTEQIAEVALSLFPAIFCLNDEERAGLGSADSGGDDFFSGVFNGSTIDALECGFDAASPDGLISLISIADEGALTGEAFAVIGAVLAECGELFAASGLLDGQDLSGLLSGGLELPDGIPIPELPDGLDLEDLLGDLSERAPEIPDLIATVESATDVDIESLVSPETLECLVGELGQERVDGLLSGEIQPDFTILGAVLACGLDLSSLGN